MNTSKESLPKISIIIPVKNEEANLERTVNSLLLQDYPNDSVELLIIVAESSDKTAEIAQCLAQQHKRIRVYENPHSLSAAARNIGVKNARGDIIIFVDGHTYIDNNQLLQNTVLLMESQGVSVLSRPQFLKTPYNGFFQNTVSLARESIIGHASDSTIYERQEAYVDPSSSGATYDREVFNTVGIFDENFDACEDVEFNFRVAQAGYRAFTSLKLGIYYIPRDSLWGFFKQMIRYGLGRSRLILKHRKSLNFVTLVPPLFTLAVHILLGLSILDTFFAKGLLLVLISYYSLILLFSIKISIRNGFRYLLTLPVVFTVIHLGLGYGFIWGLAKSIYKKNA